MAHQPRHSLWCVCHMITSQHGCLQEDLAHWRTKIATSAREWEARNGATRREKARPRSRLAACPPCPSLPARWPCTRPTSRPSHPSPARRCYCKPRSSQPHPHLPAGVTCLLWRLPALAVQDLMTRHYSSLKAALDAQRAAQAERLKQLSVTSGGCIKVRAAAGLQ